MRSMQHQLRALAAAREHLLRTSDMDAVYRQLLRRMNPERLPPLADEHVAYLHGKYGIEPGAVQGYNSLRTWRPQPLKGFDERLPRMPTRALASELDAIFVPSLDWQQRIGGAALKVISGGGFNRLSAPRAAAADARSSSGGGGGMEHSGSAAAASATRYLTFGHQFSPSAPRRGRGGFNSLRIRSSGSAAAFGDDGEEEVVEVPLHVSRPAAEAGTAAAAGTTAAGTAAGTAAAPPWVGLCEGVLKAMAAAQSFGRPVVGEWCLGAGQFYKSPTQLRSYLRLAAAEAAEATEAGAEAAAEAAEAEVGSASSSSSAPVVVLLADAGCTSNPAVALHYTKTMRLLEDWGHVTRLGWWGQHAKAANDIDDLLRSAEAEAARSRGGGVIRPEALMSWLTRDEFEQLLEPDALERVLKWRRETGFVTMADTVVWDAVRLPSL